ncbi:hypothetical protein MIND_01220400 [Mycena indigotica]|uniref:Uncharacterized protein n=1 Tax=Mycena indigotica TaxID=2126181 RepID=A0A8H6VVT1_9AGAR|nr:uncharacterized protein MIND_01220400 [Mycena indigotica]KAF7291948.1 hypothetical protein MIND_01220400 [Mycena indigotica]
MTCTIQQECPFAFLEGAYVVYRTNSVTQPIQMEQKFDLDSGEPRNSTRLFPNNAHDPFSRFWNSDEKGTRTLSSEVWELRSNYELVPELLTSMQLSRFGTGLSYEIKTTYVDYGVGVNSCRHGPKRDAVVKFADDVHTFLVGKGFNVPCLIVETMHWR